PCPLPLEIVSPANLTAPCKMLRTRLVLLPLIVNDCAPDPLIVRSLSWISPVVSTIVPITENTIVSPGEALKTAWRSDPGPRSLRLFTVKVAALTRLVPVVDTTATADTTTAIRIVRLLIPLFFMISSFRRQTGLAIDLPVISHCAQKHAGRRRRRRCRLRLRCY